MVREKMLSVLVAGGIVLGAGSALADNVVYAGMTGAQVADKLRDAGYKAELLTDKEGDPLIRSAASGAKFLIYFYGCDKAAERVCKSLQFLSVWDRDGASAETVNAFNAEYRVGKLWLDGDDMVVAFETDVDGVTATHLSRVLRRWESVLGNLIRFFEDQPKKKKG